MKPLVTILLLCSFAFAQSEPQSRGKYEIVSAKVLSDEDSTATVDTVFLLNTQTGEVWIYRADKAYSAGERKYFAFHHFEKVFVDDLSGDYVEHTKRFNEGIYGKSQEKK